MAAVVAALVGVLGLLAGLGYLPTKKSKSPETKIELSKSAGPLGTMLTVTGSGFDDGESVRLVVHVFQVVRPRQTTRVASPRSRSPFRTRMCLLSFIRST